MKCQFKKRKASRPKPLVSLFALLEQAGPAGSFSKSSKDCVRHLQESLKKFELLNAKDAQSSKGLDILIEIVSECKTLCSIEALKKVVNFVPTVRKVAMYHRTTECLLRSAARFRIFRSVRISLVHITAQKYPRVAPDTRTIDFIGDVRSRPNFARLLSRIGDIQNHITAQEYEKYPVHAEMQLLFHEELKPRDGLAPRVICSNKKACYLCNLFFNLHGKFLIPTTHGRVYEKWALPCIETTSQNGSERLLISSLCRLEQEIETLLDRQLRKRQKPYPPPFESVAGSMLTWSSLNLYQNHVVDQPLHPEEHVTSVGVISGGEDSDSSPDDSILDISSEASTSDEGTVLDEKESLESILNEEASNDRERQLNEISGSNFQNTGQDSSLARPCTSLDSSDDQSVDGLVPSQLHALEQKLFTKSPSEPESRRNNPYRRLDLRKGEPVSCHLSDDCVETLVVVPKLHIRLSHAPFIANESSSSLSVPTKVTETHVRPCRLIVEWISSQHSSPPNSETLVDLENIQENMDTTRMLANDPWTGSFILKYRSRMVSFRFQGNQHH